MEFYDPQHHLPAQPITQTTDHAIRHSSSPCERPTAAWEMSWITMRVRWCERMRASARRINLVMYGSTTSRKPPTNARVTRDFSGTSHRACACASASEDATPACNASIALHRMRLPEVRVMNASGVSESVDRARLLRTTLPSLLGGASRGRLRGRTSASAPSSSASAGGALNGTGIMTGWIKGLLDREATSLRGDSTRDIAANRFGGGGVLLPDTFAGRTAANGLAIGDSIVSECTRKQTHASANEERVDGIQRLPALNALCI